MPTYNTHINTYNTHINTYNTHINTHTHTLNRRYPLVGVVMLMVKTPLQKEHSSH